MGFIIGLFVGGIFGVCLMAIVAVGKASDEQMSTLREEVEANE